MADDTATEPKRCLFGPDDMRLMRRKFDEDCERLGVFCEDDKNREAVGRAVVRSFERGLVDPGTSKSQA
ncbi:hypothetical protein E8L99_04435 [Phreatobacter aquaticus]|uniref:Uncharacterized protein n=1 Tax=Phreatobacter aquaticus TaxID=2570229 RepID=A0A4D7QGV0_9HYPH|nr:hypothetical protein [Phreatobacter aquaticus]QCK85079.1 hypothetical protein E8L99_04435 [Phreatobacter aquaticus]